MEFLLRFLVLCLMAVTSMACAGILRQGRPVFEGAVSFDTAVTRQVVEIRPSVQGNYKAKLTAWTYAGGIWIKTFGPWPVVIGRNGFAGAHEKREGDGKTPSGVYPIGLAFGKEDRLRTGLFYRRTMEDDIWVDDVTAVQYNRWAKLPTGVLSYEKMRRTDGLYDLGAVIEYNTDPVVPGYGSAIFIHIWRDHGHKPTAGCVALDAGRLRLLLEWLRSDMNPRIVLSGQ